MDMALVDVRCQHIGIFPPQNLVGQPPDLVGLLRRGLAEGKGLYYFCGQKQESEGWGKKLEAAEG